MPHSETESEQFNLITIKELHPTFGAEISGVDFRKRVTDKVFSEILDAITRVRFALSSNFSLLT
jgi:alpha-ketoglutarate-dependent 2,4-dichlorophenoxyacetate dioxygenase